MVYVVERYLPGLSRSDLLRGLSRLEQATGSEQNERPAVRYLGSTIVLGDEACFCQFEGPSEAAVAEANTKAGLSFSRIVPALTVTPTKGDVPMAVSTPIPATIRIRRSRLVGLMAAVAVLAAGITWAVSAYAVDSGSHSASPLAASDGQAMAFQQFARGMSSLAQAQQAAASADARQREQGFRQFATGISSLAQAQQAAAVLEGLGLSPKDKEYVQAMSSLSPVEQAAAFGGPGAVLDALDLDPLDRLYVSGIASMSPVEQAAAFGGRSGERNARQREATFRQLGKGLSSIAKTQQLAATLDALGLDPKDKEYVMGIISLTPAQQAASFGR